jgi:hypothetical protein
MKQKILPKQMTIILMKSRDAQIKGSGFFLVGVAVLARGARQRPGYLPRNSRSHGKKVGTLKVLDNVTLD